MGECKLSVIVHDVEEGEISDSASSVEEISEEAFNNNNTKGSQPAPASSAAAAACIPPVAELNSVSANVNDFNNDNNLTNKQQQRVWSMRDFYKYQMPSNYSAGLYNLAWASAVQNKSLDEFLVMEYPKAENNGGGNSSLKRDGAGSDVLVLPVNSNTESLAEKAATVAENPEDNDAMIEVSCGGKVEEREEGELEEGEIDFDSDMVIEDNGDLSEEMKENKKQSDLDHLIRKGLESVTTEEAEKSLDEVSSRIQNLLDSMQEMAEKNLLAAKDVIATLSFSAIKTVNDVFCSMNRIQKECNKEMISRLLAQASNLSCGLFSDQQLKEIEVMVSAMDLPSRPLDTKGAHMNREMKELEVLAKSNFDLSSGIVKKVSKGITDLDAYSVETSDLPQLRTSQENIKLGNSKWRGLSLPLLDLHKDHDADSLPSPTRGEPSCFPSEKGPAVGYGLLKPEWPVPRVVLDRDSVPMHPYETDAVKAVSSYQQKFGRSSFLMTDRLPSPTPSEDGDSGDGDVSGEVSSASNMNVNTVNTSMVASSTISSDPNMDIPCGQGLTNSWNGLQSSYGPNPLLKFSSAKSRDPRLRLANSDASASNCVSPVVIHEHKLEPIGGMTNSRKQKTAEELVLDGPALKRLRADRTEIVNDVQGVNGTVGWLEDRGVVGIGPTNRSHELASNGNDPRRRPEFAVTGVSSGSSMANMTVNSTANLPVITPSTKDSIHSLLKDIAVNPSTWMMNILQMETQKSASLAQTTRPMLLNLGTGATPSTNVVASSPPVLVEKAAGVLQMTPHISSVDELGKPRMKPRDPRRVLHNSSVQKGGGNMELNQSLTKASISSTPGMMANMNFQKQDDLLDNKSVPSHSTAPPDIARQFTRNLKNIADIVSVSQVTSSQPVIPKITSSSPVQALQGRADAIPMLESGNPQNVSGCDGKVSSGSSQTQNDWHDVEHLFEGFDDQQKAAIHRERARRLEEQRKMFAGRKLCLVLDLDHTLLNSAKFSEVDAVHDEMLRKKEELDREKSHRHLFRFPHMGMWTKLRPGIWNFLEKASKLYELHLYTMGNKLYATEMAKLLDPKGELFAGRVISRGDDSDLTDGDPKSKDLEGVMGMESSVVIIDDSMRVWPHNKLNLIVVERYIYFPCSRRQFGLPGPSLLEIDHDERPEDGTLASSLAVIERIHQIFFSHQSLDEADVRNILASEQRKILAGCRILFSRVFPVGEANPHLHPLWQTAEQFGAVCTNSIDEKVTHVVANSPGTDKVNWGLSRGRFVVHPGWVEASALLYRRASEADFAIKP